MAHDYAYTVKFRKDQFSSYYEIWLDETLQAGPFETLGETARWLETAYQARRAAAAPAGDVPFSLHLA